MELLKNCQDRRQSSTSMQYSTFHSQQQHQLKDVKQSPSEINGNHVVFPSMISSDNSESSGASTTRNYPADEMMVPSITPATVHTTNNHRESRSSTLNDGDSNTNETMLSSATTGIIDKNNSKKVNGSKKRSRSGASSSAVTFSTVEILSFPMILGDNPACDDNGPPLTISWEPEEFRKVLVDRFEERKDKLGHRTLRELKIGGFFRQRLLNRSGVCTRDDIFNRMEEMQEIRRKRNRSKRFYLFRLKLKNFFFPRKKANKAQTV